MEEEADKLVVDVVLYLYGTSLDPVTVSANLGVEASKARISGEKWVTSSGKTVTTKTGFWSLETDRKTPSISAQVQTLKEKLKFARDPPSAIPGVDRAELDIFVAMQSSDEPKRYTSSLTVDDLLWLSSLRISLTFDLAY